MLEAIGITDAEVADATESPLLFVALTVNVYAVPFVSPEIVNGEVEPVMVAPLLAVTV